MNIFELINKLFFRKRDSFEDLDHDSLQNFQPFMINRWLSFYGKSQAVFVNETINRFTNIFDDRSCTYKMYYYLIPHLKYSRINYFKRKKDKHEEEKFITAYAANNNISKRELEAYIDFSKQISK